MLGVVKTIVVNPRKAKYRAALYLLEFSNMNEKLWFVADSLAFDTLFESELLT